MFSSRLAISSEQSWLNISLTQFLTVLSHITEDGITFVKGAGAHSSQTLVL